jgi:hypothetical protein
MPRPPKSTYLHLVTGTRRTTRHGTEAAARAAVAKAKVFGRLRRPDDLEGHALEAWNSYIAPAWWLDRSREMLAVAAVTLWAEFRADPPKFTAALHSQLRSYLHELGLTDERFRSAPLPDDEDPHFAA